MMNRAKIVILGVLLLSFFPLSALARSGTLQIEIVKVEHEHVKDPQRGNTTFLTLTNITVCVSEIGGSPMPNAYVRLVYEYDGKKEMQNYRTDVWGEATIELPFIEFEKVEATIEAVVHPEGDSLVGSMSGSLNITIIPYFF